MALLLIEATEEQGRWNTLLWPYFNGGVRGGRIERDRGEGLKGGTKVGVAVRAGGSYLDVISLFH